MQPWRYEMLLLGQTCGLDWRYDEYERAAAVESAVLCSLRGVGACAVPLDANLGNGFAGAGGEARRTTAADRDQ